MSNKIVSSLRMLLSRSLRSVVMLFYLMLFMGGLPAISPIEVQAGASPVPDFAAAAIKRHNLDATDARGRPGISFSGNRIRVAGLSGGGLLMYAYNLKRYQVIVRKREINKVFESLFDIDAVGDISKPLTPDVVKLMLRRLLESRFNAKVRQSQQIASAYDLVIGRQGLRMKVATEDSGPVGHITRDRSGLPQLPPGRKDSAIAMLANGHVRIVGRSQSTTELAALIEHEADAPVFDSTHLMGIYDFILDFRRELPHETTGSVADDATELPTLFSSIQEQLGLQLRATKHRINVVIVDRLDSPTEN